MDEELKQAFAAVMKALNDTSERLINQMSALRHDFQNTKGFLLEDAIVAGRRLMDLEERVARLEKK